MKASPLTVVCLKKPAMPWELILFLLFGVVRKKYDWNVHYEERRVGKYENSAFNWDYLKYA